MTIVAPPRANGALSFFAERFGIDDRVCDEVLGLALASGGDYADLYLEHPEQRYLALEEQAVRRPSTGVEQGIGVRVVRGDAVGYATADGFNLADLRAAARTAANIARIGKNEPCPPRSP